MNTTTANNTTAKTPSPLTPLQQTMDWAAKQGACINANDAEIIVEQFKDKTLVSIDNRQYSVQGIFKDGKRIKYTIEGQTDQDLLAVGNIIYYTHEHLCPPTLRGLDKVSAS
jgi:hypothetical protein